MGGAGSSSRSQGSYGSSHAVQVNESVYELYKPAGTPSIQVVFFHGLQPGSYTDAYLSTWTSEDGSSIWPETWLVDELPYAHVFSVSNSTARQRSSDHFDVYTLCENLISDILMANIGQVANCPVVLVGHSIGGLVIKSLCCQMEMGRQLSPTGPEIWKRTKFLQNLKGIFYFATPHRGGIPSDLLRLAGMTGYSWATFYSDIAVVRLSHDFEKICKNYNWNQAALGESLPTILGSFKRFVVPEASSRGRIEFYRTERADHFSICRPSGRFSSRFGVLRNFLLRIVVEMREDLEMKAPSLLRRAHEVEELLENASVVGIVGIAGIGKSSIAKVIFNNISQKFQYTCFVDSVNGIRMNELEGEVLKCFHRFGTEVDINRIGWSDLMGRKTLIVLDGVDSEDQIRIVPELNHFGKGSCLMITSRDRDVMKAFGNCLIYEVRKLNFGEAKKLFCDHAFGQEGIPDNSLERAVMNVVQNCDGLPLTLKVVGSSVRGHKINDAVWETLNKLKNAQASLSVRYDALLSAEQTMFIEAGTYFDKQPLDLALAAWSTAYTDSETKWTTLIGTSMVKEVYKQQWDSSWQRFVKYKEVKVHKQLRDLASDLSTQRAMMFRSVGEGERALEFLNANKVNPKTTILKLMCAEATNVPTLQLEMLGNLAEIKYLEVDGVLTDGSSRNFPRKLSLLKWTSREKSQLFPVSLRHMNNLAVLELAGWVISEENSEALGKLTCLRILVLSRIEGLHHLSENFRCLSQLKRLELTDLNLTTLPHSIEHCTTLEYLVLAELGVGELPESLGNLLSLKTLLIRGCHRLASLPHSFGRLSWLTDFAIHNCRGLKCLQLPGLSNNLSSLESESLSSLAYLGLYDCPSLESLPANFELLSSLEELVLDNCHLLRTLPQNFGQLKALKSLIIREAYHLEALPDSFGNLTALQYLYLKKCWSLHRLPESFGSLLALEEVELEDCSQLHTFRESIGKVRDLKKFGALKKVTFERIDYQDVLSEDFRDLLSLPQPGLRDSPDLAFRFAMPIPWLNYEFLMSQALPFDIGQRRPDLKKIIIKLSPDHLRAITWQGFGKISSADKFSLAVETLESVPESVLLLPSIRKVSVLASATREKSTLWSREPVEMPHCQLTDGKRPDVVFWRPEMVEDFISEVNNRGESGYFVSKTWLFCLLEHERGKVKLELSRAGYIETYQTSTTMFYERMEDDAQVPHISIDPAHTTDDDDICLGDTEQVRASHDIGASGKIEETVLDAEKHNGTFHLTSRTEPGYCEVSEVHPPLYISRAHLAPPSASVPSNETYGRTHHPPKESSSISRAHSAPVPGSASVLSNETYGRTHHSRKESSRSPLDGQAEISRTSTTTSFEYMRGHAPQNSATRRAAANTRNNIVDNKKRASKLQQSEESLPSDTQGLNRGVVSSTDVIHANPKCVCKPEFLTASFTQSSESPEGPSTSSSQGEHVNRGIVCNVKIPSGRELNMSTSVDKYIPMTTVDYGPSGWEEVSFKLNVSAETALRCCLRSDHDNKRVRIEPLIIGGAMKMESESSTSHVDTHAVVLKAVRINLHAFVNNSEDTKGPGVYLEDPPELAHQQRIVLQKVRSHDDYPEELTWLQLSGKHPKNHETLSRTLELTCNVKNRLVEDVKEGDNHALVLNYSVGDSPVNFEGDVFGNLNQNSFIEVNLRYESEISYIKSQNPLPQPVTPFGSFQRVNEVIDYDCVLKFTTDSKSVS